jgi:2-polyprenyl-6-methoxyphenol hydroxylase-like FAD-dependent oxidoreductase
MRNRDILISGAGIAGPALAFWLARFGFRPTVVERAPALRRGGQAVDFRGPVHLTILERMGLIDEIRRSETRMGALAFVDRQGKTIARLSSEFASGDIEILRGDLSRVLYDATKNDAEYIFGDSVAKIQQDDGEVAVTFQNRAARRFHLVIGADGLRSNVRRLVFGPDARFVRRSGYYVVFFSVENPSRFSDASPMYTAPGRCVGVMAAPGAVKAKAIFYFTSPEMDYETRDLGQQKKILADAFKDLGWRTASLIDAMWRAEDFYFDAINEVEMERWTDRRVTLLGDAGYGGAIGGMGTGLAIVGAYILAGELAAAGGDHERAFQRYAAIIGPYARECRKGAASVGRSMAPKTAAGVWLRNQMLRAVTRLPGHGLMEKIAM